MLRVSRGFSWVNSGERVWGSDSPVREELSTFTERETGRGNNVIQWHIQGQKTGGMQELKLTRWKWKKDHLWAAGVVTQLSCQNHVLVLVIFMLQLQNQHAPSQVKKCMHIIFISDQWLSWHGDIGCYEDIFCLITTVRTWITTKVFWDVVNTAVEDIMGYSNFNGSFLGNIAEADTCLNIAWSQQQKSFWEKVVVTLILQRNGKA